MIVSEELANQVALVTGASGGIGYTIAERLLVAGANVALHYNANPTRVQQLVAKYGSDRCYLVQTDFNQPNSGQKLFETAWSWRQQLDILVNNAALVEPVNSVDDLSEAIFNRAWQANCLTHFTLSKLVVEKMRQVHAGRIVSISSIGVKYHGSAQTIHYMTSKAALEASTLALAKLSAADGVLVNVVRAGVVWTPAYERLGRDFAAREQLIPLQRAAKPAEIAEMVLFLVSPRNSYITGAVLPVSGGE